MEVNNNNKPISNVDIDLNGFLEADGLSYQDVNDDGSISVVDKNTGKVGNISNVKAYIADYLKNNDQESHDKYVKNLDKVSFNTPDAPVQKSPLNLLERAKLNTGNIIGNMNYLKNKFGKENVKESNGNITVKKNGFWHNIDPEYWGQGDAFDMGKELLADTVVDAISIAPSTVGSIAGAIAGGIPGAGAGAMAGELARTSFGRILGTYEDSAENQVKDAAIEGVLNMFGEVSSIGVKNGVKLVGKTEIAQNIGKAISEFSSKADNNVKSAISSLLSYTTGLDRTTTESMVKNGDLFDKSTNLIKTLYKRESNPDKVADTVKNIAVKEVDGLLNNYSAGVYRQFNKLENEMLNDVDIDNFSFDATDLGKKIIEGGKIGEFYEVDGLINDPVLGMFIKKQKFNTKLIRNDDLISEKKDIIKYSVVSKKELESRMQSSSSIEDRFTMGLYRNKLEKLVNGLKNLNLGQLEGKEGAQTALQLKREIDDFYFNVAGTNPQLQKNIQSYTMGLREELASSIKGVSKNVESKYDAMNAIFKSNKEYLLESKRILNSATPSKGLESIVDKIRSNIPAEQVFTKNLLEQAGMMTNKKNVADNIISREAALKFDKILPYFNREINTKSAVTGGLAGGVGIGLATGAISGGTAALASLAMSPKLAAGTTRKLLKSGAAVTNLPSITAEKAAAISDRVLKFNAVAKALPKSEKMKVWADPNLLDILTGGLVAESMQEE